MYAAPTAADERHTEDDDLTGHTRWLLERGEIARAAEQMPSDWWNTKPLHLDHDELAILRDGLRKRGLGIDEFEPGCFIVGALS